MKINVPYQGVVGVMRKLALGGKFGHCITPTIADAND